MGFIYFQNKNWIDISREERLYCAHLYLQVRGKELEFVQWLNKNKAMNLPVDCEWEVGYEVCFYRDYLKSEEKSIRVVNQTRNKAERYSEKRTFDLCLFSDHHIVIIEAKVQQGFESDQIKDLHDDKFKLPRITDPKINVDTLLLASSQYFSNYETSGKEELLEGFPTRITWLDMYHLYADKLFLQADKLYKH